MVRLLDVSYLVYVLQCSGCKQLLRVTWWNEEMMDAVKTVMLLAGTLEASSLLNPGSCFEEIRGGW